MASACWRDLRRYKYQLVGDYSLSIAISPESDITTPFIELSAAGLLTIRKGYAWDGPSGPTIDTKNFMRGSLVHDALYQLMRGKYLDYRVYRQPADGILKQLCIEDGMSGFRASYVYRSVQAFGEKNARPVADPPDKVTCVP